MGLEVNNNYSNSHSIENNNQTGQDPCSRLPDELVLKIFSHLNLATLGTICRVSKEWKRLANDPVLWKIAIYREIAFGNDKWAKCFGSDVVKDEDNKEEFSSLPFKEFIEDSKKFKSVFPQKNAKDTLMLVRLPKTLNGGLTLKSLGELATNHYKSLGKLEETYYSVLNRGYMNISPSIVWELGDKSIGKSHWVIMTKDVLPGSRSESYGEQQKIIAKLAEKSLNGYEVPETLASAACIFSQYFGSNKHLFSNDPWTYTHCQEKVKDYQIIVGGFSQLGLNVNDFSYVSEIYGVAALRKF